MALAPGVALGGTPATTAASALGPVVLDGLDVGRVLLSTAIVLCALYALQLLAQGAAWLWRHASKKAASSPPPRLLRLPRLQNMLLKVSVPVLAQVGALGASVGDKVWHKALAGVMLVAAVALVATTAITSRRVLNASFNEARLEVVFPGAANAPLVWLLGRPGADAVWSGELVETHGNIFENCWHRSAFTTSMLLSAALAQGVLAGLVHSMLSSVAKLVCLLGLQLLVTWKICRTVPFIDSFRHKCFNVSSLCQLVSILIGLCAEGAAAETSVVVLKLLAIAISSAASALSMARRVINVDSLRARITSALAASAKRGGGAARAVSSLNPLAIGDAAGLGTSAANPADLLDIYTDAEVAAREDTTAGAAVDATHTLMGVFDAEQVSSGDDGGAHGGALKQQEVEKALFGGGAYAARHDTATGDTFNPLFALGAPEPGAGRARDSVSERVDDKTRQAALNLSLMRSVVASCATALPTAAEAEAARERAATAATAFARRMREIGEAMDTVVGLAVSSSVQDGECALEEAARAAQDTLRQLTSAPDAGAAVRAAKAVAALLDACTTACKRLGVHGEATNVARLGDRREDGAALMSPLDVLRSMLSAAKTQLNVITLIEREEREAMFAVRAAEERASEEARLRALKEGLRIAWT